MRLGVAIELLKDYSRVYRKAWGDGIYLELQIPDENSKMTEPYIYLVRENESSEKQLTREPWVPTHSDLLKEDWEMVKWI